MDPIAIDDEMYDIEAVAEGAWVPGPYGPGDQLGTYNEVTPEKRAAAWSMLAGATRLQTLNLGDVLFNGYPGFGDRDYQQQLVIAGYPPPEGFTGSRPPRVVSPRSPSGPPWPSSHKPSASSSMISPMAVASCTSATSMSSGPRPAWA